MLARPDGAPLRWPWNWYKEGAYCITAAKASSRVYVWVQRKNKNLRW